jgi:hypothetical protein
MGDHRDRTYSYWEYIEISLSTFVRRWQGFARSLRNHYDVDCDDAEMKQVEEVHKMAV